MFKLPQLHSSIKSVKYSLPSRNIRNILSNSKCFSSLINKQEGRSLNLNFNSNSNARINNFNNFSRKFVNLANSDFNSLHADFERKAHNLLKAFKSSPVDWQYVWEQLSDDLKEFNTLKSLEWLWREDANAIKASESVGDTKLWISPDGTNYLDVHCRMRNGPMYYQFRFNKEKKLEGFIVRFGAPDINNFYCDTTVYTQKKIIINEGQEYPLEGILTMPKNIPKGGAKLVVLVPNSGTKDMDLTQHAIKLYRDIASGLASKGIATIRYNSRSFQHRGKFLQTSFTLKEEILDDAVSALKYAKTLPNVNKDQIFTIGYLLSAVFSPRIAEQESVAGMIMLSPFASSYAHALYNQKRLIRSIEKESDDVDKEELEASRREYLSTKRQLKRIMAMSEENLEEGEGEGNEVEDSDNEESQAEPVDPNEIIYGSPVSYWKYINDYNQTDALANSKVPAFLLFAGRDNMTTMDDLEIWDESLEKREGTVMKLYPDVHGLYATSSVETDYSHPSEFAVPTHVSSTVWKDLSSWVNDVSWRPVQPVATTTPTGDNQGEAEGEGEGEGEEGDEYEEYEDDEVEIEREQTEETVKFPTRIQNDETFK